MKQLFALSLLFCAAGPAAAQIVKDPVVLTGTCDPWSGVSVDNGPVSHLECDVVIIARTQPGMLLIQFTKRKGSDGHALGFGGKIEGKLEYGADKAQVMKVERVYLSADGTHHSATRGTCILDWTGPQRTGGQLTSVFCSSAGKAEGSNIRTIAIMGGQ